MTDQYRITGDELRQFIERVEQLESEKKDIAEQIKEVFSEAKGRGFNVVVMREIVKQRRKNPDDVAEQEAILDLYKSALGMA